MSTGTGALTRTFADRREAGRALAVALEHDRGPGLVVVGLARGGVETAAEVARILDAPLDVVAVRKVAHPWQPEYGIGAVTPGDGVYVRGPDGLTPDQVAAAVDEAKVKAAVLDARLHDDHPPLDLHGQTVVVVDDGVATGATMIAALRWARAGGAARVVAAVPVGAAAGLQLLGGEADAVVCLQAPSLFFSVGASYDDFAPLGDDAVVRLLDENRRAHVVHRSGVRVLPDFGTFESAHSHE